MVYNDGMSCVPTTAEALMQETLKHEAANKGKWYARASPEARAKLCAAYEAEDYPDEKALKKLAKEVGAPSPACVKTFFDSLHWVLQNR